MHERMRREHQRRTRVKKRRISLSKSKTIRERRVGRRQVRGAEQVDEARQTGGNRWSNRNTERSC